MATTETLVTIIVLFIAFAHAVASTLRRIRFHSEASEADDIIAYGWSLKGFVVAVALAWVVLFLVTSRGLQNLSGWIPSSFAIVGIIVFALVLPLWATSVEFFGAEYHLTPGGIRKHSPWTRNFFVQWDEIRSVKHVPTGQYTVIRTEKGKIRIHDWTFGKGELFEALRMTGLRIRIIIDEDGTERPPSLPLGTVVRRLIGTDRGIYHLVRLDSPVQCKRATTGKDWTLRELVVSPRFKGDSLQRLTEPPTGDPLLVGIANVVQPLDEHSEVPDFSRGVYFALGRIERA